MKERENINNNEYFERGSMYSTDKRVFEMYLNTMKLTEDDLRGKKILDIGSYSDAQFVNYCLEHKITNDIFAVDRNSFISQDNHNDEVQWRDKVAYEAYKKRKVTSPAKQRYARGLAEELPFKEKSFDLIIVRAALTNPDQNLDAAISQIVSLLKSGGEARIGPFLPYHFSVQVRQIIGVLENMTEFIEFKWEDTFRTEDHPDVVRKILVIKKKM